MRRLAGLDCYYTPGNRSEGTGSSSSTAIVMYVTASELPGRLALTLSLLGVRFSAADAFGLGIPNPRLIADRIAAATGHNVWVPDLLEGAVI